MGQGLLIIEVLQSHSNTAHSVELLWTSDQPNADTFNWRNTTLTTDRHPCPRRYSNPQSQQASGRRPTPGDRPVSVSDIKSSDIFLFTANITDALLFHLTKKPKKTTNTRHLSCPQTYGLRRTSTRTQGILCQLTVTWHSAHLPISTTPSSCTAVIHTTVSQI